MAPRESWLATVPEYGNRTVGCDNGLGRWSADGAEPARLNNNWRAVQSTLLAVAVLRNAIYLKYYVNLHYPQQISRLFGHQIETC